MSLGTEDNLTELTNISAQARPVAMMSELWFHAYLGGQPREQSTLRSVWCLELL